MAPSVGVRTVWVAYISKLGLEGIFAIRNLVHRLVFLCRLIWLKGYLKWYPITVGAGNRLFSEQRS